MGTKLCLAVSKTTAMLMKTIIHERDKILNDLKRHKNEQNYKKKSLNLE